MFAQGILEVRNSKLYRLEFDTFEEFCGSELGFSDRHARRLMDSVDVVENLKVDPGVRLPKYEKHARPLSKLEPEVQREAWNETLETFGNDITAKKVEQIASEYKEVNEFVKEAKNEQGSMFVEPMTEKQILAKAKELKAQRGEDFKAKRALKIESKAAGEISEEERDMIEDCKNGNTVVININKHFHVLKWAEDNNKMQRVDRYSEFGNPFYLDSDGDRDHVCDAFGRFLEDKTSLHIKVKGLKGKVLGCHCAPLRCHGEILKDWADA